RRKRWLPGMDEHDGVAAVELRPDWLERRLAEIFPRIVGEEDHPVGPQRVERVLEFPEGALGIGQRQRREVAETIGPLRDEIRRVFVHATRHPPSLALVPADDARRGQREDPGRDLLRVHEIDRAVGRPLRNHGARGIAAMRGQGARPEGRYDMLMNVNAMSRGHARLLSRTRGWRRTASGRRGGSIASGRGGFIGGICTLVSPWHPCFHWLWAETCLASSAGFAARARSMQPWSCSSSPSSRSPASFSPRRLASRSANISLKRTPSPGASPPRSRPKST